MKKIGLSFLLVVLGMALGMGFDRLLIHPSQQETLDDSAHQVRQGGHSLINPLLECEVGERVLTKQFVTFRYALEDRVKKLEADSAIDNISVYFRNLNNGSGIGVNEKESFSPASLLKIPILIAYYKQFESTPEFFKKKIKYTDTIDRNEIEVVRPRTPMKTGDEYGIEDLLYRMIVFSDNNAMGLLIQNLPLSVQDRVFMDLGITIPGVRGTEDYMSVLDNASFFRILYNASYLRKETSQQALELLTKVDFADGIRGGVPRSVVVANKFGERTFDNKQQLHDCGIVYFKDSPYLLCVMSRGSDFNKLALSIRVISGMVYNEVKKQAQP